MDQADRPELIAAEARPENLRCHTCPSRLASIFGGLPLEQEAELERIKRTRRYGAGTLIFTQASHPEAVYCVVAGSLKLSRQSPDGRTLVLGFAGPGHILGIRALLLGTDHDVTAETTGETRLCLIHRASLLDFLARHGDVSLKLAGSLSRELATAYENVYGVAVKPVTERLAELLLGLCQSHGRPLGDGAWLISRTSQSDIAEMLGISRRSLNRALAQLRDRGLIDCGRRSIRVRDTAALRDHMAA